MYIVFALMKKISVLKQCKIKKKLKENTFVLDVKQNQVLCLDNYKQVFHLQKCLTVFEIMKNVDNFYCVGLSLTLQDIYHLFLTTKFPPLIVVTTKIAPQVSKMLPKDSTTHTDSSRATRYVGTWSDFQHITDNAHYVNFINYFAMV